MVQEGIILTKKQASDIFIVLSNARIKLNGKYRTLAEKYWKDFETILLRGY